MADTLEFEVVCAAGVKNVMKLLALCATLGDEFGVCLGGSRLWATEVVQGFRST